MHAGHSQQDHHTKSVECCRKIALKTLCNRCKYPSIKLGDAIPLEGEIIDDHGGRATETLKGKTSDSSKKGKLKKTPFAIEKK